VLQGVLAPLYIGNSRSPYLCQRNFSCGLSPCRAHQALVLLKKEVELCKLQVGGGAVRLPRLGWLGWVGCSRVNGGTGLVVCELQVAYCEHTLATAGRQWQPSLNLFRTTVALPCTHH